ncbi:MAG: hypothetical protein LBP65_03080 [Puniceicoccales bacterium]|nr:hypothetical protein [Puniceicoccales bacterium]
MDRPEELRSIRREIGQCSDDLNNAVQILTYCARMTPDANLANSALDGVLKIIGEPSPEERVYAVSLDVAGCTDILTNAESTISLRDKLLRREQSAEISLSRDYHKFARSASLFFTIKFLSISAIGVFLLCVLLQRVF